MVDLLVPPKRGGGLVNLRFVLNHFPKFPLHENMPSSLGQWSANSLLMETKGKSRKMINRRFTNPPFWLCRTLHGSYCSSWPPAKPASSASSACREQITIRSVSIISIFEFSI